MSGLFVSQAEKAGHWWHVIAAAKQMCRDKNLLKTISLWATTTARRIEDIGSNISSQL